jgi:hypothetical protein
MGNNAAKWREQLWFILDKEVFDENIDEFMCQAAELAATLLKLPREQQK